VLIEKMITPALRNHIKVNNGFFKGLLFHRTSIGGIPSKTTADGWYLNNNNVVV